MRADRLLAILLLLQRGVRTTAGELARRLEVSERTIYRDLEALSMAGVPVYSTPGRGGGVHLVEGYRTDLSGLSFGEAELVPLLGLADAFASLPLGASLRRAEAKLLSVLPDAQRERAEQLHSKIHVDLSAWWHGAEVGRHLPLLVEAVFSGKRIRIRYRRGSDDEIVRRTLDPLGLVLKAGVWYLVGSTRSKHPRTYRASRVRDATILDEPVQVPETFDLAAYWAHDTERFEATSTAYDIVVRARSHAARALTDDRERLPSDETTWTTLNLTFGSQDHALRRMLALGPDVIVDEPTELRDAIAEAAMKTAAHYR